MDNDKVVDILDKYDAGIIGEEADGAKRVAFTRCCEMVGNLVEELQTIGLDICFPSEEQGGMSLHMTVMPMHECESVPHDLLSDFKWLANKMGQYTFKKSAMQDVHLRQLFLQLESNFTPIMLEDDPGTNFVYLHVERKEQDRRSRKAGQGKNGAAHQQLQKKSQKTFFQKVSFLLGVTLMIAGVAVAFYDRVYGPIDLERWV